MGALGAVMVAPATPAVVTRRQSLQWLGAAAASTVLGGCADAPPAAIPGGFVGVHPERGHSLRPWWQRLQQGLELPAPAQVQRVPLVIVGGGMAGLAAARSSEAAGVHGAVLLEGQDALGGNSRSSQLGGIPCPWGAHYLPLPGPAAWEVQDWLEELGLRQRQAGRWVYDERHLCHSPQERLFIQGQWQEGLLPLEGVGPATLAQYQRFAAAVAAQMQAAPFAMPALRSGSIAPSHAALDSITMQHWLAQQQLSDPHLLWYLDYACRDDFGAGIATVSAWAGVHYFASRHGFNAPTLHGGAPAQGQAEVDQVLTWPEGNGYLVHALQQRLRSTQCLADCSVLAITTSPSGVQVDALQHPSGQLLRWLAPRCVVALPVWVAAQVVRNPPAALQQVAQRLAWAPWLVANIQLHTPLDNRGGAEPAWDNVLYADSAGGGLGYVDAGHQRLDRIRPQPTVLTYYRALGDFPQGLPQGRAQLLSQPFAAWQADILGRLLPAHPDLPYRAAQMTITRHGHAMPIPRPGEQVFLREIASQPLLGKRHQLFNGERTALLPLPGTPQLCFAHSDWAGYSVLEEAFIRGHHAGLWAAASAA